MNFAGKTVLITGASRGIGAAIAEAFAAENASVVVNYLQNVQAAEATVAACNAKGGNALAVQADVTDPVEARRLVAKTEDVFGKIDVLVHNAFAPFIFSAEQRKLFWDLDWDAFQAQIDGSVKAAHGMVQAVLPKMLERAEGTIITADTGFANEANMKYLHENEINAYIPDNKFRSRDPKFKDQKTKYGKRNQDKQKSKLITSSEFELDAVNKTCICPSGYNMWASLFIPRFVKIPSINFQYKLKKLHNDPRHIWLPF